MGRPVVVPKSLVAASANNISLSQSGTANTALLLNGSTGGVLDTQRRVLFTFAANETGHNFFVVGKNDDGAWIKETVAGTASTAVTVFDYKSITSIKPSANTTGALTVGTNTVGSSPWIQFDMHIPTPTLSWAVVVSGTVNWTVEYTYDDFRAPVPDSRQASSPAIAYAPNTVAPTLWSLSAFAAKATNVDTAQSPVNFPFEGYRLTVNSGTGTATLTGTQAGISGP